jgi:hypothetical protein
MPSNLQVHLVLHMWTDRTHLREAGNSGTLLHGGRVHGGDTCHLRGSLAQILAHSFNFTYYYSYGQHRRNLALQGGEKSYLLQAYRYILSFHLHSY